MTGGGGVGGVRPDERALKQRTRWTGVFSGTLKTRDWKTRDLKSMESVTIFKSKSYGAEVKTVYGGMDT